MEIVYTKELDFIPKLQLSKSRRAVYYTFDDYVKGKIPKRYLENGLIKHHYRWGGKYLYDAKEGKFVTKNTKSVGKPKYWVINGQPIYSGSISPLQRSSIVNKLHDYFKEIIKDCPKLETEITSYKAPVVFKLYYRLVLTWYIQEDKVYPDVNNLWIYDKVILDVMVKDLNVIPDDNHEYIHEVHKKYQYKKTEGFKIEIYKI